VALPSRSKLPACAGCTNRSSVQPELFHDDTSDPAAISKNDLCLDPECWELKTRAFVDRRKSELAEKSTVSVVLVHGQGTNYDEQKENKGALQNWQYDKVKKGAPGAQLALVVDGTDAGKELWIKPRKNMISDQEKSRMPPLSMRRKAHVIRAVLKALEKAAAPFRTFEEASAFAAIFGTENRQAWSHEKGVWDRAEDLSKKNAQGIAASLWDEVRPILRRRMERFEVSTCGTFYDEALRTAELLGMKQTLLDAAAELALPKKGEKRKPAKTEALPGKDPAKASKKAKVSDAG
jgi:hypothetical protein